MIGLRCLLISHLSILAVYTLLVIVNHGLFSLLPTFFGDILALTWPGQFNLDFFGFLILSALWTAWRNQFTGVALTLAVVALFGGMAFLATYLLILSYQCRGNLFAMLLGERRSRQLSESENDRD